MGATHNDQPVSGLSTAEALQRLAASGYNELNPPQPRRVWHMIADVLREPMFLLLIAAGGIYLLLGNIEDALMLLFFVLLIITLTVFQEHKSERVLETLRDLSSPRALVLRDGRQQRIAGREVVPGDLLLAEGDRVAADAVLLSCNDLLVDESLLTGEPKNRSWNLWSGPCPLVRAIHESPLPARAWPAPTKWFSRWVICMKSTRVNHYAVSHGNTDGQLRLLG